MKLKLLIEGLAKKIPDFNEIKTFLANTHKKGQEFDSIVRASYVRRQVEKLVSNLEQDYNVVIDNELLNSKSNTKGYFNASNGEIAISPEIIDNLRKTLLFKNSEDWKKEEYRLIGLLTHEMSHRYQTLSSKGLSNGSVPRETRSNDKVDSFIADVSNDAKYLADKQEISAFASQLAVQLKHKGLKTEKEVADYIDDKFNNKKEDKKTIVHAYKEYGPSSKDEMKFLDTQVRTPEERSIVKKVKKIMLDDRIYKRFLRSVILNFREISTS